VRSQLTLCAKIASADGTRGRQSPPKLHFGYGAQACTESASMIALGMLLQRPLMAGCRRTPSRTYWPLLLQSCPSGKDSTAGKWNGSVRVAGGCKQLAPSRASVVSSGSFAVVRPPTLSGRLCAERPARPARVEGRRQRAASSSCQVRSSTARARDACCRGGMKVRSPSKRHARWPPQQATPFSLARLAAARLDCGLPSVVRTAPALRSSGTKSFPALSSSPTPLLSSGR